MRERRVYRFAHTYSMSKAVHSTFSHSLTLSLSHPLTLSPSHPLTLSPSHPLTLSPSHSLTLSHLSYRRYHPIHSALKSIALDHGHGDRFQFQEDGAKFFLQVEQAFAVVFEVAGVAAE